MNAVVLLISSQDENNVTVWSSEEEAKASAVEYLAHYADGSECDTADWGYDDYVEFAELFYHIQTQISFHLLPTKGSE
tara:strand:+ start:8982 stop:9215 length:234 start_codon:yes stop_codon:yes gene_type:complete